MDARKIALISTMSAVAVVVSYGKGLAIPFLPGLIEFTTVIVFVTGFCFGKITGGVVGMLSMIINMLVPYPFAHPASWIFTISPILLAAEALLGGMYGVAGGFLGKRWSLEEDKKWKLTAKLSLAGFVLTFVYQILSSIGFYLAYPVYPSVWEAIYLTFIPLYYPYPPIIHAITNPVIFASIGTAAIYAIKRLSISVET